MSRVSRAAGLGCLLVLLMGAQDDCDEDDRHRAQRHLGDPAVCTWRAGGGNHAEVRCIKGGNRYDCLAPRGAQAQCAIVTSPEAEQ